MTKLDVMVLGAAGRMGSLTASTVAAQPDMRLTALVDAAWAESDTAPIVDETVVGEREVPRFASVDDALAASQVDVAIDFTLPASVYANARRLLTAGVAVVVGATGLTDDQVTELEVVRREHGAHLFIAPNFALGAVLLMRFAHQAAGYFGAAEIVELHHPGKLDAPSGTALRTARLMREAAEPSSDGGRQANAGAESPARGLDEGGVRIHSIRLPGLVAHQEVVFGGHGETLTIRHDSISRESFMVGVLLAVRHVRDLPETVVGLEHLLA